MSQRDYLTADNPRHRQPINCSNNEIENRDAIDTPGRQPRFEDVFTQNRDEENNDENKRERIQYVDKPHHQVINPTTHISGHRAISHTDDERHERSDDPDDDRDSRSPENPRKYIAAELISPGNRADCPATKNACASA